MNRMMKIALGAVLAGFALPVFAQDNFADVPDNHWAYEAVENLKKAGCLVGYPDGLFRGNRPMSRYEFAAAAHACWQKMMGMFSDMSDQIENIKKGMGGGNDDSLKKQLDDLKAQVDGMKGWGSRIADLEKMTKEFEKELASMGVDVKKMRQDLGDLESRVSELEKHKPAVDIHGDINFLVLAGHSTDNNLGMTPDNRIVGLGDGSYAGLPVGLTRDLTVLHEAAFNVKGTNTEGPKWEATIVAGNMLSGGFGSQALGNMGGNAQGSGFSAGSGDMYINTANVTFDTALVGQGFNAKIGRVGHKVGPYLWKRTDFTSFYKNERWDNGEYYFDGGILSFAFGKAGLKVFGGTNSSVTSMNGTAINPIGFGGGMIDRTLGVQLDFPVGEMGNVNLAYLWHDSDTLIADVSTAPGLQPANRLNVFGGQIDLKFDKFGIWGAYSQSTLSENTSNALDDDNRAWDIRGSYNGGNWGAGLGYREVENNFAAAGSWGRLGNQFSPTNIKGFMGRLWFQPTEKMKIWASGEFDEPKDSTAGFNFTGYDKINMFKIGLDYQMAENWGLMLGYEDTRFDGNTGVPDDKLRWYTIGFNYGMSANANLWFTYQFSDNEFGAGSLNDPLGAPGVGGRKYRGGLFGTQLSLKF